MPITATSPPRPCDSAPVIPRSSLAGLGIVLIAGALAGREVEGQCTPFFPPTECPLPAPLACPDSVLGDFCGGETWFVGPGGLLGVLPSGNQLQIDQNCDGEANDPGDLTFNAPAIGCAGCSIEYRLSPSQEYLYARVFSNTVSLSGCVLGQSKVFYFGLDAPPNLTPFDGPGQGACMTSPIADGPIFYDRPGDPIRTAVTFAGASAGKQAVLWADLAGRSVNVDRFTYFQGLQRAQFSQRGNAAFLRTVSGGFSTRYYLVDLCRSPVGAASAVATSPFPASTNFTSAEMTGSTGALFAVITHNGGDIDIALDDCLCGACCDGGSCDPNIAVSECGGTFVQSMDCSPDPCSGPLVEACCLPNGLCDVLDPDDCEAMGGSVHPGVSCAGAGCVPVTEACCDPSTGACFDVEAALCAAGGGNPGGVGSTCAGTNCPPPAGTQACCLPSGGCINLPPAGPFPSCTSLSGQPQGAGSNCLSGSTTCPTANLTINKTAPVGVREGESFTYTITFGNSGPNSSTNVQVRETLPAGAVFISASNAPNGSPAAIAGGVITWSAGTMAAGASGQQVTVTMRAGCNVPGNQIVNGNYQISGTPGATVTGTPVTTSVTPTSSAPISIAVASLDLNGPPLGQNDLLEHRITLVNSAAVQRDGIVVRSASGGDMSAGCASRFETAVDAGGGSFSINAGGAHFRWTGSLGANGAEEIAFTTRVNACINATALNEGLNCIQPIGVFTPCGQAVGSASPTEFELLHPVAAELVALNLAYPGNRTQTAREGASLEFELTLSEQYNQDHPAVTASLPLPAAVSADPTSNPLINPPPGAIYDAAARTITYSGPLAAGQILPIRWNGLLDSGGPCRIPLAVTGSVGTCASVRADLLVLVVPVLPLSAHILGIQALGLNQGLWMMEAAPGSAMRPLLCIQGEIFTGMDRLPDGEIWITDAVQLVRFNPAVEPPELEQFGQEFILDELNLAFPSDVAFDPTLVERSLILVGGGGGIRRFYPGRPVGQRVEVVLNDAGLGDLRRVSVDTEGMIVVQSPSRVARIDASGPLPIAPGDYARFEFAPDTDFGGLLGQRSDGPLNLTLDTDGDYLVTVLTTFLEDFGHPFVAPLRLTYIASLVKLDRNSGSVGSPTGAPQTIVERMFGRVECFGNCPSNPPPADVSDAMFPGLEPFDLYAAAVNSNGDGFLSGPQHPGAVFVVERQGVPTGSIWVSAGAAFSGTDLEFVDSATPPMVAGDLDGDGDVDADDFAEFEDAFGTNPGDPGHDPAADLDHDGDIDCDDWRLFGAAWSPPHLPFFRPCLRRLTPGSIVPEAARASADADARAKGAYCGGGAAAAVIGLFIPLQLLRVRRIRSSWRIGRFGTPEQRGGGQPTRRRPRRWVRAER